MIAGIVPERFDLLTGLGAVFGLVSMVFMVTGLARLALRAQEPWPAGETLVAGLVVSHGARPDQQRGMSRTRFGTRGLTREAPLGGASG